jgi:hypothetical protein
MIFNFKKFFYYRYSEICWWPDWRRVYTHVCQLLCSLAQKKPKKKKSLAFLDIVKNRTALALSFSAVAAHQIKEMWSAGKEQQQQHIYNTLFREVKYPRENLILMYRAYWLFFIQILFFLSFLFLRLLHVCNRRALSWQTQQHKRHTHAWRDPLINQYFNQLIYAVCIIPDVTDSRKKQTHTHTQTRVEPLYLNI